MEFRELNLIKPLLTAVRCCGYVHPTPIQEKTIPPVLEGRDVLGCAQTGTGKTAAFALPILQKLFQMVKLLPKSLIPVIVDLSHITPLKPVNQITREERAALVHLLKHLTLTRSDNHKRGSER